MKRANKVQALDGLQNQHIQPLSLNQQRLLNELRGRQIVVATGSAGVGKTFVTVHYALNQLATGSVKKLILTRANIPTGRSLGFFPGTVQEKLEPWLAPMISIIRSRLGPTEYDRRVRTGSVQLQPLEVIRGASFDDAFIIVDEAQNLTFEEIKTISTRIGERTQLAFLGDLTQKDINNPGLPQFLRICAKYEVPVGVVQFNSEDIVRSDIVRDLVKAFDKEFTNEPLNPIPYGVRTLQVLPGTPIQLFNRD